MQNNKGETLLHYACYFGFIDKFYALIDFGANIKTVTNNNNNLLHYCCAGKKDDFLVIELIKMGILPSEKNDYGQDSFHFSYNERTSYYLNLWAKRNNMNLINDIDHQKNNIAHTCVMLKNFSALNYWLKEYPAFKLMRNNKQQLFSEAEYIKLNFCK